MQRFCDQPHTQSEAVNEALAFVQTIQLSDGVFEFVMPEHQLSEPAAFAVLLDITLERMDIAVVQFSDF